MISESQIKQLIINDGHFFRRRRRRRLVFYLFLQKKKKEKKQIKFNETSSRVCMRQQQQLELKPRFVT